MRIWKHVDSVDEIACGEASSFSNFLLQIGNGTLPVHGDIGTKMIELPNQICLDGDDPKELLYEIYGLPETWNVESTCNKAIVCAKNVDVDRINAIALELFPGEEKIYRSIDSVSDRERETEMYAVEFLNSLTPSGMPQHKLRLKVGCTVMLMRNLNVSSGLANGTRLTILRMHSHVLEAQIVNGSHKGTITMIPRITLNSTESELPFTLKRLQFPIRLAAAMTINKSQGQSLDAVGIYLKDPVFSHGQLYVAILREGSLSCIRIMGAKKVQNQLYTLNIVYRDVLK